MRFYGFYSSLDFKLTPNYSHNRRRILFGGSDRAQIDDLFHDMGKQDFRLQTVKDL